MYAIRSYYGNRDRTPAGCRSPLVVTVLAIVAAAVATVFAVVLLGLGDVELVEHGAENVRVDPSQAPDALARHRVSYNFV